jgi:hypothetical protein
MKKSIYFKSLEEFTNNVDGETGIWLLLIGEACIFSHSMIDSISVKCYGGVFPEIIYESKHYKDGLVAIELENTPLLIKDITQDIPEDIELNNIASMFVIVDGLSAYIDSFLFSIFELIDEDSVLFGGGAGKLTLEQEKVIFTPEGIYEDAALVISLTQSVNIGVSHGWEYLEGPFVATSSDKNVLKKIDYENAFDVYKKVVEKDSGLVFNKDNFFEISKSYPLGIVSMDNEVTVRDPIFAKDGALILVGIMPENSIINILKGENAKLINAAEAAAKEAYTEDCKPEMVFMIDCISRVLFLEDSFKEEIQIVQKITNNIPLVGALTLGEIANNSKTYIDFYNKTCVVGVLCLSKN